MGFIKLLFKKIEDNQFVTFISQWRPEIIPLLILYISLMS